MRAALNHDWLKNHYLLALDSFLNVLDDLVENQTLLDQFVSSLLPEWQAKRPQICFLIDRFGECMSPRALFTIKPLFLCPAADRECLGSLVDRLWRERWPIDAWEADVLNAIGNVDKVYGELHKQIATCIDVRDLGELRAMRSSFTSFRRACFLLSRAIEVLPGTLEVL